MNLDQSLKSVVASEEARQVSKFQEKLAERERKRKLKKGPHSSDQGIVAIEPLHEGALASSLLSNLLAACWSTKLIPQHISTAQDIACQLESLLEDQTLPTASHSNHIEQVRQLCQRAGMVLKAEELKNLEKDLLDEHGKVIVANVAKSCGNLSSCTGMQLPATSADSSGQSELARNRFGIGRRLKPPEAVLAHDGALREKLNTPPAPSNQKQDGRGAQEDVSVVAREHSVEESIFRNMSIETEGPLLSAENSVVMGEGQQTADQYPLDFTHSFSAGDTSLARTPHGDSVIGQTEAPRRSDVPVSFLSPRAAARELLNVDLETWLMRGSVEQISSKQRRLPVRLGLPASPKRMGAVLAEQYRQAQHAARQSRGSQDGEKASHPVDVDVGAAGAAMRRSLEQMRQAPYAPPSPLQSIGGGVGDRGGGGYSRELRRVVARAAGEEAGAAAERLGVENSLLTMHFDDKMKQAAAERGRLLQQLEESVAICSFLRAQLERAQSVHASTTPADSEGVRQALEGVRVELSKLGDEREGLRAENTRLSEANRQLEENNRRLAGERESAVKEAETARKELRQMQAKKTSRKAERQCRSSTDGIQSAE